MKTVLLIMLKRYVSFFSLQIFLKIVDLKVHKCRLHSKHVFLIISRLLLGRTTHWENVWESLCSVRRQTVIRIFPLHVNDRALKCLHTHHFFLLFSVYLCLFRPYCLFIFFFNPSFLFSCLLSPFFRLSFFFSSLAFFLSSLYFIVRVWPSFFPFLFFSPFSLLSLSPTLITFLDYYLLSFSLSASCLCNYILNICLVLHYC